MNTRPFESAAPLPTGMPAVLTVRQAATLLGIGRSAAYQLVRTSSFPTPVLRIGSGYRIPTAPLLQLLGIQNPMPDSAVEDVEKSPTEPLEEP